MLSIANPTEKRLIEQIRLIFSDGDDLTNDSRNVNDIYSISKNVVNNSTQLSNLEKKEIVTSIQLSQDIIERKLNFNKALDKLQSGNLKSFIVMPLFTNNNSGGAIVRKNVDNNFNFIVTDKDRPIEELSKIYIGVTFTDKIRLVNLLSETSRLNKGRDKIDNSNKKSEGIIDKISSLIDFNKKNSFLTTIYNGSNSELVEVEHAIRIAIMTREFSFDDLNGSINQNTPKISIEDYHRDYLKELKSKYKDELTQNFIKYIDSEFENYSQNIKFENLFKLAFNKTENLNKELLTEKIKESLPDILQQSFGKGVFKTNFNSINLDTQEKVIGLPDNSARDYSSEQTHILQSVIKQEFNHSGFSQKAKERFQDRKVEKFLDRDIIGIKKVTKYIALSSIGAIALGLTGQIQTPILLGAGLTGASIAGGGYIGIYGIALKRSTKATIRRTGGSVKYAYNKVKNLLKSTNIEINTTKGISKQEYNSNKSVEFHEHTPKKEIEGIVSKRYLRGTIITKRNKQHQTNIPKSMDKPKNKIKDL